MDVNTITAIVMAALGGGGFSALLAYRKTAAETDSVSVATLKGVLAEMREEREVTTAENRELRREVREVHACNERLLAENSELRDRVTHLERMIEGGAHG